MQYYLSFQIVFVWGFNIFERLSFVRLFFISLALSVSVWWRSDQSCQTNCVIVGVKTKN